MSEPANTAADATRRSQPSVARPVLPDTLPAGVASGIRFAAQMLRHLRHQDGYQDGNTSILPVLEQAAQQAEEREAASPPPLPADEDIALSLHCIADSLNGENWLGDDPESWVGSISPLMRIAAAAERQADAAEALLGIAGRMEYQLATKA